MVGAQQYLSDYMEKCQVWSRHAPPWGSLECRHLDEGTWPRGGPGYGAQNGTQNLALQLGLGCPGTRGTCPGGVAPVLVCGVFVIRA